MDKLHFWCYKILPLVYDDSLSYYEVLCKLREKVNEMITAINDGFSELIPEALEDYMNTPEFRAWTEEYIEQFVNSKAKGFVSVDDYGAVGDGETNDYAAFRDAISAANSLGVPVIADGTKTYALQTTGTVINVETSMDLHGATIKVLNNAAEHIFDCNQATTTEQITQNEFTNERFYDSKYFNKCIWIKAPIAYSIRPGFDDYTYHEQLLTTDGHGYFTNAKYIPNVVNGTYDIEYKDVDVPHITIENITFDYSDAHSANCINVNRCHVTVRNIAFIGRSSFVGSGHNSHMSFTKCFDLTVEGITGNNIYPHDNSGYLIGLYVVSDYTIKDVKTHLPSGTSWPIIGTSFVCNGYYLNCNMNRIEVHYSSVGHMHVDGCTLSSMGIGGGWGAWLIENCNIVDDGQEEFLYPIGRNGNTNLPFTGTITFKNINFYNTKRQFSFTQNSPVDDETPWNIGETLYIVDGITLISPQDYQFFILNFWNDAVGSRISAIIRNIDYRGMPNATIETGGQDVHSIIIENCRFKKLSYQCSSANNVIRNCEFEEELYPYPNGKLRGNLIVDGCVFTGENRGPQITNCSNLENLVVKNCFIAYDHFYDGAGVTNSKTYINNVLTGETKTSYDDWNSGYNEIE